MSESSPEVSPEILELLLSDAHSHPHDDETSIQVLETLKCRRLCIMGTRPSDWNAVKDFANAGKHNGIEVIQSFGIHPWFAHMYEGLFGCYEQDQSEGKAADDNKFDNGRKETFYAKILIDEEETVPSDRSQEETMRHPKHIFLDRLSLDEPVRASHWISLLRQTLLSSPKSVLGEIGLDSGAHLRTGPYGPLGVPQGSLTKTRCSLEHQREIFRIQMRLAAELGRPVSIHCVRAQGALIEELKGLMREFTEWIDGLASSGGDVKGSGMPPNVCLHSYTGSAETVKALVKMFAAVDKQQKSRQKKMKARDANVHQSTSLVATSISYTPRIYFSFSSIFSGRLSPKRLKEIICNVPEQSLLLETDLDTVRNLDSALLDACRMVAEARGWTMMETANITTRNYMAFVENN